MTHLSEFSSKAVALALLLSTPAFARDAAEPERDFIVREGYQVTTAAKGFEHARFLEIDDDGTLYVSMMAPGKIMALRDEDGDGEYETQEVFVSGQPRVHGMDLHDGWLWFATPHGIHKARDTDQDGKADDVEEVIRIPYSPAGGHEWRPILITDEHIYTSIGDSGNINDERRTIRQKMFRYDHNGRGRIEFASGIRNTEKFRLRPGTQEIWGCDHGSDWFGRKAGDKRKRQPITDMNPPDEFNKYVQGGFYGHPFITGNKLPRYEFISKDGIDIVKLAEETIPPEWSFPAHWAVNGFCFIDPAINARTEQFPSDHSGDAFIAAHGSWNREVPDGYCVARVLFDDGSPYGMLKIVSTISEDRKRVYGRPVDCVQAPDGSILFSCDYTNRVYRIRHIGQH